MEVDRRAKAKTRASTKEEKVDVVAGMLELGVLADDVVKETECERKRKEVKDVAEDEALEIAKERRVRPKVKWGPTNVPCVLAMALGLVTVLKVWESIEFRPRMDNPNNMVDFLYFNNVCLILAKPLNLLQHQLIQYHLVEQQLRLVQLQATGYDCEKSFSHSFIITLVPVKFYLL